MIRDDAIGYEVEIPHQHCEKFLQVVTQMITEGPRRRITFMSTKTFHISDILSITTETLVSTRGMDGVCDLLEWMTGDQLFIHQLPRAAKESIPSLREQFPDLAAIQAPTFDQPTQEEINQAVRQWAEQMVAEHGATREVDPLAPEDHTYIDPISELVQMRGSADGIVVVELENE